MATMAQPISPPPSTPKTRLHHAPLQPPPLLRQLSLSHLKQTHAQLLRSGLDRSSPFLLKVVLSSFSLSPSLDYALSVFTQIHDPQTRISNRVVRKLSRSSEPEKILLVYEKLRRDGSGIDRFGFPALLKASSRVEALIEGMEIHGFAAELGYDSDPFVQTAVVRMYATCSRIWDARKVFDKISHRDVVT